MNSCVLADSDHFGRVQVSMTITEFHLNHLDALHNATHSVIALAMDLHQNKTWHRRRILAQLSSYKSENPSPLLSSRTYLSMWMLTLCCCALIFGGDTVQPTTLQKVGWQGWQMEAQAQLPVSASERPKLSHFPCPERESSYRLQDPE